MSFSQIKIKLTNDEKNELQEIVRKHKSMYQIVIRAKIISSANNTNDIWISHELNISRDMVTFWKKRWNKLTNKNISAYEKLQDVKRSGAPLKFTAEQICKLFKIACEKPQDYNRPISHWTARELSDELIKQNIVQSISPRHVGRLLEEADLKPHKIRYYLDTKKDENFHIRSKNICNIYSQAFEINNNGGKVFCNDEMCGIQALEREAPDKLMKPGQPERHEFNYKRHGTLSLIANLDVATGKIINPTIGPTRNEEDFKNNIMNTIIEHKSSNQIHFIVDNLNTHQSKSLVKLVSEIDGFNGDLGKERKYGIMKSMKTRQEYLSDINHKIVFHYTPKHSSWLNQIEIWFSILVRKLLKRASFKCLSDLKETIFSFIDYFNNTMAKPFKWTYKGKVLAN